MADIDFDADAKTESIAGASGGGNFSPAPRGIYTLQIADHSDGEKTQSGKYVGTPITKLTCEIADECDHFGKRVWHNVTWIPRGTGEKANPGHGMAVHFLHAVGLPFDGKFKFAESDLQGRTFRALLGISTYDKIVNGRTYTNEKNFVEEVYTEAHPEPDKLPPPRGSRKDAQQAPRGGQTEAPGAADGDPVPF